MLVFLSHSLMTARDFVTVIMAMTDPGGRWQGRECLSVV
jgi:hypothetical protein